MRILNREVNIHAINRSFTSFFFFLLLLLLLLLFLLVVDFSLISRSQSRDKLRLQILLIFLRLKYDESLRGEDNGNKYDNLRKKTKQLLPFLVIFRIGEENYSRSLVKLNFILLLRAIKTKHSPSKYIHTALYFIWKQQHSIFNFFHNHVNLCNLRKRD